MSGRRAGLVAGAIVLSALAGLATLAGCGGPRPEDPAESPRVLVFGIDGADWDRAIPLIREGRMPALARLMRDGASRTQQTVPPSPAGRERLSPTIWTTAVTGVLPERHGILHFVTNEPDGTQPVTSNQRKVAALWNMATVRDHTVGVLGWLVTWPAERVNGYVVSSYTPYIFRWNSGPGSRPIKGTLVQGLPDQVWPPELQPELERLKVAPEDVTDAELQRRFTGVPLPASPDRDAAESLQGMRWSWAADATYERVFHHLAEEPPGGKRPQLELLYFASVDVVSHRFWKYMEPGTWTDMPLADADIEAYGRAVESAYRNVDGVLERVLARETDPVRTFVLSDHGFRENDQESRATSSGWHRPEGILVAAGPGLKEGVRLAEGSLVDAAPTVLYALGLPVADDFDGDAALELFTDDWVAMHDVDRIPSWEPEVERLRRDAPVASPVDAEILDRLESLGYLD